jgi:hypothetical protein
MAAPIEADVLAKAKRNFIARNQDDRAWDEGFTDREVRQGHPVLCLSEDERGEFLAQARHELMNEPIGLQE